MFSICRRRQRPKAGLPDFDAVLDRRGTFTEKHDLKAPVFGAGDDAIPMWVADLDLPVCPRIQAVIAERAAHPSFGYTLEPEQLWGTIAAWFEREHRWKIDVKSFIFSPSVMLSACFCIRAFTDTADAVMVFTPLYHPLQDVVEGEGRVLVRHPLVVRDASSDSPWQAWTTGASPGKRLEYTIDFTAFEEQLQRRSVRMLLFCSPHNPGSKVWTEEELRKVVEICRRHHVIIISDEIHADWCLFGTRHTPTAMLAAKNEVIMLGGPGKSFGVPGLKGSFVVIADENLRTLYRKTTYHTTAQDCSIFGAIGMHAAYENGKPWLESAQGYIEGNMLEVEQFLEQHVPEVVAWHPQGTFLMWLDFSALGKSPSEVKSMLVKAGVLLSPGDSFGEDGRSFQRLNVACSRRVVHEALLRVEAAVKACRPLAEATTVAADGPARRRQWKN